MRLGRSPLPKLFWTTPCPKRAPISPPYQFGSARWSTSGRTWSTPLAKTIADAIETTGPISIAAYMRQCLTSPNGGYYTTTRAQADQFGSKGDFTTSPEISQVFGELVGIWFVTEWLAQGRRKNGVRLMELGPGRGTLMDDLLRTVAAFDDFAAAIETVYLVEASEGLRAAQKRLLCGDREMRKIDIGWTCESKHGRIPVAWVEDISLLPTDTGKDKTPFVVAHEFFDALPIHAFESIRPPAGKDDLAGVPRPSQWRELLVSAAKASSSSSSTNPEFALTTSPAPTPLSLVLPESSARYRAVKKLPGSTIEISPDSHRYMSRIAQLIAPQRSDHRKQQPQQGEAPSGAALIIDYGPLTTIPTNTLRGIQNHALVSPFLNPGRVDLSADVDFTALAASACEASPGIEAWGPVEQGGFLVGCGGRERVEGLVKAVERNGEAEGENKKRANAIRQAWERLTEKGGGGMGRLYKVLALLPENGGRRTPVGFGGGVVENATTPKQNHS